jgi:hypothetical protein
MGISCLKKGEKENLNQNLKYMNLNMNIISIK